jgi:hypothetical protein
MGRPITKMVSNDYETENIDYERFELLSKIEVALREDCSEKTVENRVKAGTYTAIGKGKDFRVLYPKKQFASKPTEVIAKPISEPVETVAKVSEEEVERLRKENETLRSQLMTLNETVSRRDETNTTLNNQLQNAHTALAKRNLPAEIDPHDQKIDTLSKHVEELTKTIQIMRESKPWWKFW